MVCAEAARCVTADGELGHIALVVVVGHTAEVGQEAVGDGIPAAPAVAVAVFGLAVGVVNGNLPFVIRVLKALGRCSQIRTGGTVDGVAEHCVDAVQAELLVVGEQILDLPGEILVHRLGRAGAVVSLADDGLLAGLVVDRRLGHGVVAEALGRQEVLEAVAVAGHVGEVGARRGAELEAVPEMHVESQVGDHLVGAVQLVNLHLVVTKGEVGTQHIVLTLQNVTTDREFNTLIGYLSDVLHLVGVANGNQI